jgi:mono/diheme cytochrome c family protein
MRIRGLYNVKGSFATMTRSLQLTLTALAVLAAGIPASAPAQGRFAVDANLAKRGGKIFNGPLYGCYACHSIGGGRRAGPDLAGVTDIRDHDWLRRWLKNTDEMIATDPQAQALYEQWLYVAMPTFRLRDDQITALIHYMAMETQRVRGRG